MIIIIISVVSNQTINCAERWGAAVPSSPVLSLSDAKGVSRQGPSWLNACSVVDVGRGACGTPAGATVTGAGESSPVLSRASHSQNLRVGRTLVNARPCPSFSLEGTPAEAETPPSGALGLCLELLTSDIGQPNLVRPDLAAACETWH